MMVQKITLQLDELTCPACLTKIKQALKKQPGISNIKVLFNSSKIKADFEQDQITAAQISQTVTQLGYQVLKTQTKEL